MSAATSPASEAYTPTVLDRLTAEQRAALDRYVARALDDPEAAPLDDAERGAVAAADAIADRLSGRSWTRAKPRRKGAS